MPNNFQSINSGKAELKDSYLNKSMSEAIRRRRQDKLKKLNIVDTDMDKNKATVKSQFPNPFKK